MIDKPRARETWVCNEDIMQPIDIGSSKQLFVDDRFISTSNGVELTMNPPYQAAEPVVTVDAPWEDPSDTSFGIYSSVLGEDDGRVRLWYHVRRAKEESELSLDQAYVGYAESTDGIHFDKPELHLIDEGGSTVNNVVIPSKLGGSSVWIDPHAPPEERYKNQSKVYNPDVAMQFHMHSSPDGIHWKFLRRLQLPHRGGWDTQSIIFWDPAIGRYVLYTRRWVAKRHTTAEGNENYRTVRRLESDDLINWDNQQTVMWPDEEDLATYDTGAPLDPTAPEKPYGRTPMDYYGAAVFKYPDPNGVYVMLANANWYWFNREPVVTTVRDDMDVVRTETQQIYGPSRFDVRLSVSRDGVNFLRCGGRRPFLSPGPEGSFSSRMVWAMPHPVRMGDEIWIYYSGTNRDHDGLLDPAGKGLLSGIGRAVLRLDGFVSADAGYGGGEIVTPIVRFEGERLELNLDTGGGGAVRVELQDADGRPVSGYTERDASYICGNSVRMPVRWGESGMSARYLGNRSGSVLSCATASCTRFSSSTRRVRSSRFRAFALRLCRRIQRRIFASRRFLAPPAWPRLSRWPLGCGARDS